MTDHTDLIDKLLEWATAEQSHADTRRAAGWLETATFHDNRAALLREAAKALGGGE